MEEEENRKDGGESVCAGEQENHKTNLFDLYSLLVQSVQQGVKLSLRTMVNQGVR